jgi:drug/metabolite transporter (DMT)-like permease
MQQHKYNAHFAIVAANIIFGLNIPVTKSLIANWLTPTGYTFTRMLFGTIVFWIVGLFLPKEKVMVKDLFVFAIGGFFGFVATQFLFASALRFTTPVYFSLIMSLTPVLVLVLSVLFMKETTTSLKIIGTLLSILGAFLIIIQSTKSGLGSNNLLGIGLSVLSALSYAIYLLVTGNISVKYKPVTVVKYMFFFSLLMILPFGFTSFSTQKMFSSEVTTVAIMQLSFALLFSTVLAFFLMPIALSKLKASTVSIYMNLQPLTASIVAIVIGQDTFSWDKPLTAVLVIAGVYLVTGNEK